MNSSDPSDAVMRVRLIGLPRNGEFDEYDFDWFRIGQVYELKAQLASLLIIAGYAELVPTPGARRETAADSIRWRKK